jgi:hypothetical protein
VSVAEVLPTRREPTMLMLWMPLSALAAGVDWACAKAFGARANAVAPYRPSTMAWRIGVSFK